ncbi:MAG: hypothetical protein WBV60_05815 [Terriglobales bacterium]
MAVLALVIGCTADQPASPIQLVDPAKGSLTFTWKQLKNDQALISVWNGSQQDIIVSASLTDLNASRSQNALNGLTIAPADQSKPPTLVRKLGKARFLLKIDQSGAEPSPGAYTGFLILEDVAKRAAPFSTQVTITIPDVTAAVAKMTSTAWRLVPFAPLWHSNICIPLKNSEIYPGPGVKRQFVGFLTEDAGGFAPVWWLRNDDCSGGYITARLTADQLPHSGKYSGSISFDPAGQSTADSPILTVIAKDVVVWPILCIIGGIYVAFATKRYLGVIRSTLSLREQEAALGDTYEKSHKQFEDATRGAPSAAYVIDGDLKTQRGHVLDLITKIEDQAWLTDVSDNQNYRDASDSLQKLRTQVADWGNLGPELSALAHLLFVVTQGVDDKVKLPPADEHSNPAAIDNTQTLLVGGDLEMAGIAPLRQRVSDTMALLKEFDAINKRLKIATESFKVWQGTEHLTKQQKASLDKIHTDLVTAWGHLWHAEEVSDAKRISTDSGPLDSAEIAIAVLESRPVALGEVDLSRSRFSTLWNRKSALISDEIFGTPLAKAFLPEDDDRRRDLLAKAIALADRASAILAFALAVLTGLTVNYLGKPFGTVQDYIALFLWAAGTKATLDIVTSVLDKFVIAKSKA